LVKKCPYCGRDIPDDAVFCPYCSRRLQAPASGVDRAEIELLKLRIDRYRHEELMYWTGFVVSILLFIVTSIINVTFSYLLPASSQARDKIMILWLAAVIIYVAFAGGFLAKAASRAREREELEKQLEWSLRSAS